MSEPQEKQSLPSDVSGDAPPAVDTTAGNDSDNSGGRDLSKANPLNQAAHSSAPGVPRTIRSRTGQTEDPLPEGKHVAEHKCASSIDICLACCSCACTYLTFCLPGMTMLQLEHASACTRAVD